MTLVECSDMLRCMWRDMQIERLSEENAELRELVRDMYVQFDGTIDFLGVEERMFELGVEV